MTTPRWLREAVRDGIITPTTADILTNRLRAEGSAPPPQPPAPPRRLEKARRSPQRPRRISFAYATGIAIGVLIAATITLALIALIVTLWRIITGA